jgi:nucleoside-diphosphate-sugar epimerase
MVKRLLRDGWDVVSVDLLPYGVTRVGQHTHIMQDCRRFFAAERSTFDMVVHCAAVVGGRASIDGNPLDVATNLSIDAEFFHWVVETRQRRVVYYSSSAAYPVSLQVDDTKFFLTEEDLTGDKPSALVLGRPDQTYGWAKLTGEYLATFARQRDVEVYVLRPFSGYGAGQSEQYPMTALVARALRGEDPFDVWCSSKQARDWIHIDDVVNATLAVVAAREQRPVNVCSSLPVTFEELVEKHILPLTGHTPSDVRYRNDMPTGVHYRCGSIRRLHRYYVPQIGLSAGVLDLIEHLTRTGVASGQTD